MAEKSKIFIQLLIDRTGSMAPHWQETISAINAYIREIGGKEDLEPRVGLAFFDKQEPHPVLQEKPDVVDMKSWTPLRADDPDIAPRGWTPLFDAIGLTVGRMRSRGFADNERVQLVIMTDGQENASREYRLETVKALLKDVQDRGWAVIFLGANLEAFSQGATIGTQAGLTAQYDVASVAPAMASLARATTRYAASGSVEQAAFTEGERARMRGKGRPTR